MCSEVKGYIGKRMRIFTIVLESCTPNKDAAQILTLLHKSIRQNPPLVSDGMRDKNAGTCMNPPEDIHDQHRIRIYTANDGIYSLACLNMARIFSRGTSG